MRFGHLTSLPSGHLKGKVFWASIGGPSAEDTLETFHHWASWLCANFMYIGIKNNPLLVLLCKHRKYH